MFPPDPKCAGQSCHRFQHAVTGMQGYHGAPPNSHPQCFHGNMAVQPHQGPLCFEVPGLGDHCEIHDQNASADYTSCACAALMDYFPHRSPRITENSSCHGPCSTMSGQLLHDSACAGMCNAQHHCQHHHTHCTPPVYQEQHMPAHEVGLYDEGVSLLSDKPNEQGPVEYEYYVWDAVAQEYIQTDQKTGEKLLQDPQYFQYHYRLVENTQNGEACLLPEPLDGMGSFDLPENSNAWRFGGFKQPCLQQFQAGHEDGVDSEHYGADALNTPEALVTPRRQECFSPPSPPQVGYMHEPRRSPGHQRRTHEKENQLPFAFDANKRVHEQQDFEIETTYYDCDVDKLPRERDRTPRGKNRGLASNGMSTVPYNLKFISCSRPWGNASVRMRDHDLQVRQLRHLQRVQQLEKEELLRRQAMLDEMVASLPRSSKHLAPLGGSRNGRAQTPLNTDTRTTGKKISRPRGLSSLPDADGRVRSDPVNRGRYFRAKWKSDRFLEQQRHPAFDVKAYDAWLKNSGHLLRARALELQQEEQRLVSILQQERSRHLKRCP